MTGTLKMTGKHLDLVKKYQAWRMGEDGIEMPAPKEITESLSWVIAEVDGGRTAFEVLSEKYNELDKEHFDLNRLYQNSLAQIRQLSKKVKQSNE